MVGLANKEYLLGWNSGDVYGKKRLFVKKMESTIDMQNRPNDYLYRKLF